MVHRSYEQELKSDASASAYKARTLLERMLDQAEQALRELKVRWKDWPGFPRQDSTEAVNEIGLAIDKNQPVYHKWLSDVAESVADQLLADEEAEIGKM